MSLIRWSPNWDPFAEMQQLMHRPAGKLANNFMPAVDMYETKTDIVVEAPLAGINPKDVEVQVEQGMLTIKGETKREREVEEKNYYRKETRSGSFFRTVPLPVAVKEDAIDAEFADGVLKITCPKAEQKQSKKIAVKVKKKDK